MLDRRARTESRIEIMLKIAQKAKRQYQDLRSRISRGEKMGVWLRFFLGVHGFFLRAGMSPAGHEWQHRLEAGGARGLSRWLHVQVRGRRPDGMGQGAQRGRDGPDFLA